MYQFVKKILMAPDIQGYKKKVFFDEYNVKINLVPPLLLTSLL